MTERNVISPSAPDSEAAGAAPQGREAFVAPCVEDLGDLSTLTLLGGTI
jgi:hypothetical protein